MAIVTGAGTGIGEAIAHKFAKEGARVVVAGLPDDPIEDVAKAIRENNVQSKFDRLTASIAARPPRACTLRSIN